MRSLRRSCSSTLAGIALLALATAAGAEVTGITSARSSPLGAATFGTAGPYEQLDGIVSGEIDPEDPRNRVI